MADIDVTYRYLTEYAQYLDTNVAAQVLRSTAQAADFGCKAENLTGLLEPLQPVMAELDGIVRMAGSMLAGKVNGLGAAVRDAAAEYRGAEAANTDRLGGIEVSDGEATGGVQ